MSRMQIAFFACMLMLVTLFMPCSLVGGDKKKESPCDKPPIQTSPPPSKEELKKARDIRAQGSVNIAISEEGDVTDAKVVRGSSSEAAEMLLKRAKSMKFQSRPGCGTFRTTVNYTLQ